MKYRFCLLAFVGLVLACSDPGDSVTPQPTFSNSPTCVYLRTELVDGNWRDRYYFFDLNHSETSDKKFFAAEFLAKNYDTMKVVIEPRSIDSLGINFPAEIMDYPGFGGVASWTNPEYLLKVDAFNGSFYKDPNPTNPASNLYFLNQPEYVGAMAGNWPNAYLPVIRVSDGAGGYVKYSNIYFYFKHDLSYSRKAFYPDGTTTDPEPEAFSLKAINDMVIGPDYEWETVESAFSSPHSKGPAFPQHYFLDFKKWRYFVWTEGCNGEAGCLNRTIEFSDYKSLDKMLKWPEGWGQPD